MDADQQAGFAAALCAQLRESRRRQSLTQAQVATRTNGLVSKAALANYETGHRSLRVDVFWVIARALGEDCGALIAAAERSIVPAGQLSGRATISLRVADVLATTDEVLAPVRRWFSIRHPEGAVDGVTESLGEGALKALAHLMGMTVPECRARLIDLAVAGSAGEAERTAAGSRAPGSAVRSAAGGAGVGGSGVGGAGAGGAGAGGAGARMPRPSAELSGLRDPARHTPQFARRPGR
nr:helix-turn-helix transcriptional regulator [Nakamurella aerolata]